VQLRNPRSGRYVKIDRSEGKILAYKKSEGPCKNVPIAPKKVQEAVLIFGSMSANVRYSLTPPASSQAGREAGATRPLL
jgi:hypothetical protein